MSPKEIDVALEHLEGMARKGHAPSHFVARHVLLSLGRTMGEEGAASAPYVERALAAGLALGPAWAEALQAELSLACGEYAQCLDPRFATQPNYDIAYTRSARARLDDRLRAAQALGFHLGEQEAHMLELADRVLAAIESGAKPALEHPKAKSRPNVDTEKQFRHKRRPKRPK